MENILTQKSFDDLKCSDNFMFAKIMEDPDLCKAVLETLLDIKIERLSYPEPEKGYSLARIAARFLLTQKLAKLVEVTA